MLTLPILLVAMMLTNKKEATTIWKNQVGRLGEAKTDEFRFVVMTT